MPQTWTTRASAASLPEPHVQWVDSQPHGFDTDHRSSSRIQAAQSAGLQRDQLRDWVVDFSQQYIVDCGPYEHFNEVHPHSALKMKSPREFRQQQAAKQRQTQIELALYCE